MADACWNLRSQSRAFLVAGVRHFRVLHKSLLLLLLMTGRSRITQMCIICRLQKSNIVSWRIYIYPSLHLLKVGSKDGVKHTMLYYFLQGKNVQTIFLQGLILIADQHILETLCNVDRERTGQTENLTYWHTVNKTVHPAQKHLEKLTWWCHDGKKWMWIELEYYP